MRVSAGIGSSSGREWISQLSIGFAVVTTSLHITCLKTEEVYFL